MQGLFHPGAQPGITRASLTVLAILAGLLLPPGVMAQQAGTVEQIKPVEITTPSPSPNQGTTTTIINTPNMTLTPTAPASKPASSQPLTVASGTASIKWGVTGTIRSTCGGINPNGTLQEPCRQTPAKFEAEGAGGCPAGAFAGLGSCWSCPAGFTRNIDHKVDSDRACAARDDSVQGQFYEAKFIGPVCPAGSFRDNQRNECWACPAGFEKVAGTGTLADNACAEAGVPRNQARRVQAVFVQPDTCPSNAFRDPRNGGECWACPDAAQRTAFPVTGNQACRTPGGLRFAKAVMGEIRQCAPGQIHDRADSSNQNVAARIRAQFGGNVPVGIGRGTAGTCWSCPVETKRTALPIWGDRACSAQGIDIVPATYVHPGIFGLDGGQEVALALIRERTLIESIARYIATENRQPPEVGVRAVWSDIASVPQSTTVLQTAMLSRIQAAAAEPQKATADELRLAASFAAAIRSYRIYMAQTALDAYDLWSRADVARRGQRNTNNMQGLMDYGTPPPDLANISAAAIVSGLGVNVVGNAAMASLTMTPLVKFVFPFAERSASRSGQKAAQTALTKATQETLETGLRKAAETGGKTASKGVSAIGSIGPQIIVTIAIEVISTAIEQIVDIATARPKLEAKLRVAQGQVDIARMLKSDEGSAELFNQWSLLISGQAPPPQLPLFASLANANLAAPAGQANAPQFDIVSNAGTCLRVQSNAMNAALQLVACQPGGQRWISVAGQLKPDATRCLADGQTVTAAPCTVPAAGETTPAAMHWDYRASDGRISNQNNRCLAASGTQVIVTACTGTPAQKWAVRQ